jgi:hypothetical protein
MADDDYRKLAGLLKNKSKHEALRADPDKALRDAGADPAGVDASVKSALKQASVHELDFLATFNETLDRASVPGGIQADMV